MECPFICDSLCIIRFVDAGITISIVCVSIALLISVYLIARHLLSFNLPYFQSKIIIILMMAPFYGLISILSLELPVLVHAYKLVKQEFAPYFELVRDIYLAFLLFTFFYLMFSYMAYDPETKTAADERVYETMIKHEDAIHHLWPINYCTDRYLLTTQISKLLNIQSKAKAKYFTYRCKKFVLQYFVLKPILTIALLVMHPFLGKKAVKSTSSVLDFIIVVSESFSLYYLILFYYALKKPLQPYSPLLKFLIIKITLFFTFWQNLTLSLFADQISSCFFSADPKITSEIILSSIEVRNKLDYKQNTLVCMEMLAMTIACIWAFTYKDFQVEFDNQKGSLADVFSDTWQAFSHDFRLIKPKKFGFTSRVIDVDIQKRLSERQDYDIEMYDYKRLSKAVNVQYI